MKDCSLSAYRQSLYQQMEIDDYRLLQKESVAQEASIFCSNMFIAYPLISHNSMFTITYITNAVHNHTPKTLAVICCGVAYM